MELALWAAAGRWEWAASRLERDPDHQHGVDALRGCADELAALLSGHLWDWLEGDGTFRDWLDQ
jgi:hypothetical protein